MATSFTIAAIQTITRTNEPDRTILPDDLMTKDQYVVACLALFEDCKVRTLEALLKCVRFSLMATRKRFASRYLKIKNSEGPNHVTCVTAVLQFC